MSTPALQARGLAFQPGVSVCCTQRPQLRAGGVSGVGLGPACLASALPGMSSCHCLCMLKAALAVLFKGKRSQLW